MQRPQPAHGRQQDAQGHAGGGRQGQEGGAVAQQMGRQTAVGGAARGADALQGHDDAQAQVDVAGAVEQPGRQAGRDHAHDARAHAVQHLDGDDAPRAVPEARDAAAQGQGQQGAPEQDAVAAPAGQAGGLEGHEDHGALGDDHRGGGIGSAVDGEAGHGGLAQQGQHVGVAQMEKEHDQPHAEHGQGRGTVPEGRAPRGRGVIRLGGEAPGLGMVDVAGSDAVQGVQAEEQHAAHDREDAGHAVPVADGPAQHGGKTVARMVPGLVASQLGGQVGLPRQAQGQAADGRGHGRRADGLDDLGAAHQQRMLAEEDQGQGGHDTRRGQGQQQALVAGGVGQGAQGRGDGHARQAADGHDVAYAVRCPAVALQKDAQKRPQTVADVGQGETEQGKTGQGTCLGRQSGRQGTGREV